MTAPPSPAPVGALRKLARRAAQGEPVTAKELDDVLVALEPFARDLTQLRTLQAIAKAPAFDEAGVRRRLYHAARALARRIDLELEGEIADSRRGSEA
jgi:hypothetical protein